MGSRYQFIKGELENIYDKLNTSYECVNYTTAVENKRFLEVFKILMEINEKSDTLQIIIKGNYLFV